MTIVDAKAPDIFAWAYRFDSRGAASAITPQEQLDLHLGHEGFVWLHIDLGHAESRAWIMAQERLPHPVRDMLVRDSARAQMHADDDFIWGVVPDFALVQNGNGGEFGALRFALAERFVISARKKPLQAIETTRESVACGRRVEQPMALLETIMVRVADAFEDHLESVADELARLEDRIIGEHTRRERLRLSPLRREIVRLGRQLQGLRGVFHRLDVSPDVPISDETRKSAARLYQRMDALSTDAHALADRARLLHDELSNRLTAETNRQLYILTVLATFMMPPTLITGAFGMNVKGLPFGESPYGFLWAVALCLVSVALTWIVILLFDLWLRPPRGTPRSGPKGRGR